MRRRTLIASPLKLQMTAAPVSPPQIPVTAERAGTQLKAPRGVILVDTREQNPLDLSRFPGWFAGVEKRALALGDYTVVGMEDICVVERKGLDDLIHSLTDERPVFIDRLRRMSSYPHPLLVVTAALSQIKSPYLYSGANPNHILQSLVALLAGLGVPFIATETHELGEEIVASYLYQIHLYDWLDKNDHGRFLGDDDLYFGRR
jgi:ERCC4-type nuclease